MPIGVSLQLFDGTTPQANLSGIQALWWDVVEPKDAGKPVGKSAVVTTDASGYISLDLSNVSGLTAGDYGFLSLYKLGTGDMTDSLIFSGKVVTSTVASGVDMGPSVTNTWVRDPTWLALPTVLPTEQKMVGLYAIYSDANFIAFTCAGNYTVDWGDGVTENFASGVIAYHQYTYANAAFDGTETTSAAGLTYKQAIVTVTPQAASALTSINLTVRHTATTVAYTTGWLDIVIAAPSLASFAVPPGNVVHRFEQISLISSNLITDFSYMFDSCFNLASIPLLNTAAGTNFSSMFGSCYSLTTIPLLNTAAGTDFRYMFYNCVTLHSIPLLNTAAGTNFSSMFYNCGTLPSIPLLNTAAGTDFSYMFDGCYALKSIPLLNTAAGTNFSYMFGSCRSLHCGAMANTKISISYASCKLSAAELNKIYTNLFGPVTSKTITVTGNYGATSDTPSIATDKGWTVTG